MNARPPEPPAHDPAAVRALIRECAAARDRGDNETVVRQTLIARLAAVFPGEARPWWVERHIRGAESQLAYREEGRRRRGAADSVVGSTAVEYKPDLRIARHRGQGTGQLRQYAAGLLNVGHGADSCLCVLSDGVEWVAYRIERAALREPGGYEAADVELGEIERLVLGEDTDPADLVGFLARCLGREGVRPLAGASIAADLGLASAPGRECADELAAIVAARRAAGAAGADMALHVRARYASYAGRAERGDGDGAAYARECYLVLLARLICANVLDGRPLRSGAAELDGILDGSRFAARGLRVVEHDQFDWLLRRQAAALRPVARKVQRALFAYDFRSAPGDDLFGELLAGLADPGERILLGQACTPMWLARRMAGRLFEMLPEGEPPRFLDMCCGSGAMLVAATGLERERLRRAGVPAGSPAHAEALTQAATGFDIDPVAVILARINWIVSNRDALDGLGGGAAITPPVYQADALFALAPVFAGGLPPDGDGGPRRVLLGGIEIEPPGFILRPAARLLFEALLERCRRLAEAWAGEAGAPDPGAAAEAVDAAAEEAAFALGGQDRAAAAAFAGELAGALARLRREGRDGVWSFVIGNSYRPAFQAGQCNGILSNPPWLAMSKIGGNPFRPVIAELASRYGLTPAGAAAPHLEMSTVFLASAAERYLRDGGAVACVLPDTVRNGRHHEPFRAQAAGRGAANPRFAFRLGELWSVDPGAFGNLAVVAIGRRAAGRPRADRFPGYGVSREGAERGGDYFVRTSGDRTAWCTEEPLPPRAAAYDRFRQGADVMPRRLAFFAVEPRPRNRIAVAPIGLGDERRQLVDRAKKHLGFEVERRVMPARFAHPCLLSNHLAPFALAEPSLAVLPAAHDAGTGWRAVTERELAVHPQAADHFRDVLREGGFGSPEGFWGALDMRRKLSEQRWRTGDWLVAYAAGGGIPAAAHARIGEAPAIVDQTLYAAAFADEDEALYVCGVMNSRALRERIACFAPGGAFGDRHLHTLPQGETPRYDPDSGLHAAVAGATRRLVAELDDRRGNDPALARMFTIGVRLEMRRVRIRRAIEGLPAFAAYDRATRALYADPDRRG